MAVRLTTAASLTDIDPSPSTYEKYCFEGAESDNQLPEPQSMVYDMWHLLGINQEQQEDSCFVLAQIA